MIEYINMRCNQWAEWHRRREDNGLGFPRECCYTRLIPPGDGTIYQPNMDEEAWQVHQAVRALPDYLQKAVMVFYLGRGTVDQKARDCSCARRTLFDRIHTGHNLIMDWLNTEAAGLPHQSLANSPCIRRTVSV